MDLTAYYLNSRGEYTCMNLWTRDGCPQEEQQGSTKPSSKHLCGIWIFQCCRYDNIMIYSDKYQEKLPIGKSLLEHKS